MLRNLGIRWQILSALALPVLVLALVAGQATYSSVRDMRQANEALDLSAAAASFTALVTGLQGERLVTMAAMAGAPGADAQLKSVRGQIDGGVKQLRALIYKPGDSPYNDEERAILEQVSRAHDTLPAIRAFADSGRATPAQVAARYTDVIQFDLRVPSSVGLLLADKTVQKNFERFSDLGYAVEALSQEQLAGLNLALAGRPTLVQQQQFAAAGAAAAQWLSEFEQIALPSQKEFFTGALKKIAPQTKSYQSMKGKFAAAGVRRESGVNATLWTTTAQARIAALATVLQHVAQDGTGFAQTSYDNARRSAQITAGGALAVVLLMLLVALALSRRISRPLRRLTVAATQVRDELPAIVSQVQADDAVAIPLPTVASGGRNEVELLAAAFTDVNAVTLRIAREQAILRSAVAGMFVNVARRNQTLLSRQLSFIDHLERTEENPDSLENLFRLDHLAARMRRNAESLLVLAGVESGRRLRHAMPLSDVVRTATSEIEHYDRVSLVFQADPPVFPHLALPTAHLLAELLENATNFSDPGSEVIVSTAGHVDGIRLTITDSGLGMTDEELEEANARIAQPPASEGIGSQRLGFFVVGRLAQRLDSRVTLRAGRARGTVVTVDLPASLFEAGSLAGLAPATEEVAESAVYATTAPARELTAGTDTTDPFAPPVGVPSAVAAAPAIGLPRRANAPGTDAPQVPAARHAEVTPAAPATSAAPAVPAAPEAPAARETAGTAGQGWAPTLPEAWAPLPGESEPGYEPDYEPEVAAEASPALPMPADVALAPAPGVEPEVPEVPESARPALFSGFRSRREASAVPPEGAPAVPALEPAAAAPPVEPVVEPVVAPPVEPVAEPEVPSPWSPEAYEPRPEAAPETAVAAPEAAPEATLEASAAPVVPTLPPAEPYDPPLPAALAGAVWSPPAPEGAYPLRRQPSSVPLEPSATPAGTAAEPDRAPSHAPEPFPAPDAETGTATGELAEDGQAEDAADAEEPTWSAAPMDVLPARRGRAALRRTKKAPAPPAARSSGHQPDEPVVPPPARPAEPRTPTTAVPAEAAAEWAALAADVPPGTSPAPAPIEVRRPPAPESAPTGAPRSAIASEALTELSRLSYAPAAVQDEGRPSLRRRTPAPPHTEPEPGLDPDLAEVGQRARTAANVRSMLAGFKAGVERGRTSPSAHRPAPRLPEGQVPTQRHVAEDGDA